MCVHNYSGKHFTLYVKNNFRIVLFYSCVLYILLYIYISSLKNPLKAKCSYCQSFILSYTAKCSYCQSFIFKKIYDPPPWGHPIPVGPGAAWSKLTPLTTYRSFNTVWSISLCRRYVCFYGDACSTSQARRVWSVFLASEIWSSFSLEMYRNTYYWWHSV
jgi:hypothetical protein